MQPSVLIVSPIPEFAEPLTEKLAGAGDYHVRWVQSAREALNLTVRLSFDVVILDASLSDIPISRLRSMILEIEPGAHILAYPSETNQVEGNQKSEAPEHKEAMIMALKDMLEEAAVMEEPAPAEPEIPVAIEEPRSPWLQDRHRAAQILVSFLMETQANAAMLVWRGGIFASAGDLEKHLLDQVLSMVNRDWHDGSRMDLARFIRIGGVRYCLYAMPLADSVLIVVQGLSIPFSQLRMQAVQLAYVLGELPPLTDHLRAPGDVDSASKIVIDEPPQSLPTLEQKELPYRDQAPMGPISYDHQESETDFALDDAKVVLLTEMLASLPPPNPEEQAATPITSHEEQPLSLANVALDEEERLPLDIYDREDEAAAIPILTDLGEPDHQPAPGRMEAGMVVPEPQPCDEATQPVAVKPDDGERASGPVTDPPRSIPEAALPADAMFEQEIVFNQLAFTYVLVPRMPDKALSGDLATRIKQILPAICLAYGWNLVRLLVKPDHLMWSVKVSADEMPSQLARQVRQQTSQRIYSEFTHWRQQNPGGDFWAPGYMVIGGSEPPAPEYLRAFIKQTRRQQGSPVSNT